MSYVVNYICGRCGGITPQFPCLTCGSMKHSTYEATETKMSARPSANGGSYSGEAAIPLKKPMTQTTFIQRMKEEHDACVEISRKKNADYSKENDPFHNFRGAELVGVDPAAAILVRMTDKMSRVGNLIKQEGLVTDESVSDTLRDIANYALILLLLREDDAIRWANGRRATH